MFCIQNLDSWIFLFLQSLSNQSHSRMIQNRIADKDEIASSESKAKQTIVYE